MAHYGQNPDGMTGNRSSSKVHRSSVPWSFLYGAMVLRWLKALTPKNYYGDKLSGNEKAMQIVQDVLAVVQWTNVQDIQKCPFHRHENPFSG